MAKRMLVDATHPEETRVVVVSGHRVEEFDFETSTKKQLKGNIYLARVTRVEPSLQAAFVEYGGNRHGFLAFSEIHPDYYRIPVADRQALLAAEAAEDDDDHGERPTAPAAAPVQPAEGGTAAPSLADALESRAAETQPPEHQTGDSQPETHPDPMAVPAAAENIGVVSAPAENWKPEPLVESAAFVDTGSPAPAAPSSPPAEGALEPAGSMEGLAATTADNGGPVVETVPAEPVVVESIGGDELEEVERRRRQRPMRHYKIQEVIKRRQILLVQVVKEERGTKGAALTTYLSLPGRYCVLMPNTARGGGISRRITNAQDRKRLKQIMEELQVPDGMAVILRTAGMERSNAEIKRDYEYLMRLWDDIRELTLHSVAPCLIYEEGNLVKRAIRDIYSSDIDEILVEGEAGHESARSFMGMLMPDHVDRVRRYDDPAVPLFQRFQVEAELDNIHSPSVRLRSGGYIVINQTEALVAIDVNSGRATRERHIEETALKTNVEAAEEIARQLRLRDLAGLIVIDFIDMEEHRNQHTVERRLKEAMRSDRARIQIGRISPFGLLELSRQRLRPSLAEVSSEVCVHCGGTGRVRSTESTVLHVLRAIEEEGMRLRTVEAMMHVPTAVALYMLNHKRDALARIETRYGLHVTINADDALIPPAYRLDRTKVKEGAAAVPAGRPAAPAPVRIDTHQVEPAYAQAETGEDTYAGGSAETSAPHSGEPRHDGEDGGRRRRRRRRRGRERHGQPMEGARHGEQQQAQDEHGSYYQAPQDAPAGTPDAGAAATPVLEGEAAPAGYGEGPRHSQDDEEHRGRRRRRRGRRGGRHRHEGGPHEGAPYEGAPQGGAGGGPVPPVIVGPGHDLPPESPFASAPPPSPPRIEGPGDAHDWPWNRRAERFPDEEKQEAAAAGESHREPATSTEQVPVAGPTGESEPPQSSEPQGPPRKGWWRRLTS